jgi:hypothetical protein
MEVIMNIFDHWLFSLAGLFADSMSWKTDDGFQHYMLRFDFVGGKQSVELDEVEFNSIVPRLEMGLPVRMNGKILQNNGKPRLKVTATQIKGIDPNFKDLTPIELRSGSVFRGVGEVIQRKTYVPKIGDPRFEVYVKTMGGTVMLSCSSDRFSEIADKGMYVLDGKLVTDLSRQYDSGKVSYQSVLVYQLDKVTPCDENGEPVGVKDVRRSGKEAA